MQYYLISGPDNGAWPILHINTNAVSRVPHSLIFQLFCNTIYGVH